MKSHSAESEQGKYRGREGRDTWADRRQTRRERTPEPEYGTRRARFNNRPAPEGTLPPQPPVQKVVVVQPAAAETHSAGPPSAVAAEAAPASS